MYLASQNVKRTLVTQSDNRVTGIVSDKSNIMVTITVTNP